MRCRGALLNICGQKWTVKIEDAEENEARLMRSVYGDDCMEIWPRN